MAKTKKSSSKVSLYNPGNSPVVYTKTGHVLGGDERAEVDSLDEVGQRAVDHGYLVNESVAEDGAGVSDQSGESDEGNGS